MTNQDIETRTSPDTTGHVSVEEAARLFSDAGVPRNPRTIRRYCQRGVLASVQIDTENNQQQYLIERSSIDKRITELKQIHEDMENVRAGPALPGTTRPGPDMTGQVSGHLEDFVAHLKEQVREKDKQIAVKDQQIGAMNRTLDSMIERDRETNVLLKVMQDKLLALDAPSSEREDRPRPVRVRQVTDEERFSVSS